MKRRRRLEQRTPSRPSPSPPDRITTYVLGAFLLLGVIFLVIAGVKHHNQQTFIAESDRGTGQVVDLLHGPRKRQLRYTAPVVAYTWQGQAKTHTGAFSQGIFTLRKGEEVPLFVHRSSGEALIDTFGERWFVPAIFSLLGLCFLFLPLWVGYRLRRSRPRQGR